MPVMARSRNPGRPRLLDLFCCGGGAGEGYRRAGFGVVGIDIAPQPNYPFVFGCADALSVLRDLLRGVPIVFGSHGAIDLSMVDAIHASPPCQAYSPLNAYNHKTYPDLVDETRDLLIATGLPYAIENVTQAPLRDPMVLCGGMFGLRVYRHRAFESNVPMTAPAHPKHVARCVRNGYLPTPKQHMTISGGKHSQAWRAKAAEVMGVPWTKTIREVCEAIPPAYTQHVGGFLLAEVTARAQRKMAA